MVVQGTNVAHLLELQALAMSLNLPTYLVQDAGLTQVGVCHSWLPFWFCYFDVDDILPFVAG